MRIDHFQGNHREDEASKSIAAADRASDYPLTLGEVGIANIKWQHIPEARKQPLQKGIADHKDKEIVDVGGRKHN